MNLQEYKKRYDEGSMKMNPELENIIKTKNNEVFSNPAFPKIDKDGNATNYIELLSYKRFLDCLDKVVYYTNIQNLNNQNAFGVLQEKIGEAVFKVIEIESSHKPYLKDLGINLIIEELGLPSDAFVFENELVGLKNVQSEKTELEGKEPTQQQIESEFSETAEEEFMTANEMYELEKQKRRLINMFIQGASKKGHYMFQLVRDDLNRINPELVNLYGIIMSINDLTYWIMPESLMKVMASSNVTKAGLESIEEDEGKTKIKTQSINFPVSLHEMIKGVYEVFGTHGLPDNPLAQEMVIESTDTLMNEIWDIRFGVGVWEKFLQSFPLEVFESDKKYLQHYLFMRLCSLDAHQLFKISRYIISDDPRGVKFIENMVKDINIDVNKREVQNIFGDADEDDLYYLGGSTNDKEEEINYKRRRIKNLQGLIPLVDETQKIELLKQIESIEKEILDIENSNPNTEVKKKKPFLFFEKGGKAQGEYDVYDNKRMLENQANEVEHHSEELSEQVKLTKKVPAWVIAKMERATTDLSDITHYLDGENKMEFGGKVGKKYNIGDVEYEVVPFPRTDKFAIVTYTYDNIFGQDEWLKSIIRDFKGNPMKFNDIKSAEKYIDSIVIKYPLGGIEKASYGAILFASQLAQQQQQQPQQVVYYIPQQAESVVDTEIVQNIPEYNDGGQLNNKDLNDMCITEIIELANDLQEVKYYKTSRHENDMYSEKYDGKLIIVFKEPVQVKTMESINDFIEQADGCKEIFEQSVNVSGEQEKSMYLYLKSPVFSDLEYKNGGKVYEYSPKKINIDKTTKITTDLGDYVLGLITKEFVYFVNPNESDENAQTILYNKNGELLSDNIFATNDLFETLETETDFEFIHPDMKEYRDSILDKE
jgi:hypothetical protein